jgi:RNA polymerase primary sigma factor
MAERTVIVCDVCGKPAAETITIKANSGNYAKDLCAAHVAEFIAGGRKPRPGRRKGQVSRKRTAGGATRKTGVRKTGARKTGARTTGTRKSAAKKTTGRKRGRPRKTAG